MAQYMKSSHNQFKKKSKKTLYRQFEYSKKKKKDTQEESERAAEVISKKLGLPPDILAGAPIINSIGRTELVLENYTNIIEYTGQIIKVQTKLCRVIIEGTNLDIAYFCNDEMKVTGMIHSIHYQ